MGHEKTTNKTHDCTDCLHYGTCYLISRGRDPKNPCKDLELDPWLGGEDDERK